jgi:hypothetical protein
VKKKKTEKSTDFTLEHEYVMDLLFISIISLGIFFLAGSFSLINLASGRNTEVLSTQAVEIEDFP